MKVVLEAQYACTATPRGVHYVTIDSIRNLLKRKRFNYELTFFDGNCEMNNRQWINKYFGEFQVPMHECNSLDYRTAIYHINAFRDCSYNEYTQTFGDVYHFFNFIFPDNIKGNRIVSVYDMTPLINPEYADDNWNRAFAIGVERLKMYNPTIITDSQSSKSDINYYTGISIDKIHVVPLGFDKELCFSDCDHGLLAELGIGCPFFLYIGGINANKNIARITEAFEIFAESVSGVNLVIAGNPAANHSEPIIKRIRESPYYSSRILMPGYVTDGQKHALYSSALAFLFPSLYEGFGLPVLEAMAHGCPVITSNVSSLPEVAGDAAILIDPYDTEQLAFEMERVITSASLQKELSLKGLEQSKKFSWDKTAEMIEQVYISVAE